MIRVGGFLIDENMTKCKLPEEVQTAWDEIYGKRRGCDHIPVLYCGRQVVSGMNYMVVCKTVPVVLHPELGTKLEKVVIHAPLPSSTTDSYHEISRETLIDSPLVPDTDGVITNAVNPYVEYQYIFKAEYAVGMSIYVPSKIHDKQSWRLYVIGGKVVELDYESGLCLREAKGIADISGSFEKYPEVKQFSVGDYRVTAEGEGGKYQVILWHNDVRCFSLHAPDGMTEAEIKDFIESLRVTN